MAPDPALIHVLRLFTDTPILFPRDVIRVTGWAREDVEHHMAALVTVGLVVKPTPDSGWRLHPGFTGAGSRLYDVLVDTLANGVKAA